MARRMGSEKFIAQSGNGVPVGVSVFEGVLVSVMVGVSVGGSVGVTVGVGVANRPESAGRLARCVQSPKAIMPQITTTTSTAAILIQRPAWLFFAGTGAGEAGWRGSVSGGMA